MSFYFDKLRQKKMELLIFVSMGALYFLSYFQRIAIPGSIFNQLQTDFNASAASITALGAIFLYIYAVMQIFVGYFNDRYGGIKILCTGGVIMSIGVILFPLCSSVWQLYLCRALTGLGACTIYLSIIKESDSMFGRNNFALVLGIIYVMGYSGGLAGTMPFERMVHYCGWRPSLLTIGILTAAVLIIVMVMVSRKKHKPANTRKTSILKSLIILAKNKNNYTVCYAGGMNFAIYFTFQTSIGKKFLEDYAGLDSYHAGLFTFTMMASAMTTLFLSGLISRLAGNRRKPFILLATILSLSSTAMILTATLMGIKGGFFLCAYVMLAVSSGFATIFNASIREYNPPEAVAFSIGAINGLCYLFAAVIANMAGFVMDIFKDNSGTAGSIVVYPAQSYEWLFFILLLLSSSSFITSLFIKETMGKELYMQERK